MEDASCRMPWERCWSLVKEGAGVMEETSLPIEEDEAGSRHYRLLLNLRLPGSVLVARSARWVTVKTKRTCRRLAAVMISDGEDGMEERRTNRGRHAGVIYNHAGLVVLLNGSDQPIKASSVVGCTGRGVEETVAGEDRRWRDRTPLVFAVILTGTDRPISASPELRQTTALAGCP
ncbi:hypothetical protein ACLOJK_019506 [Asimina triloba]